jgi:hypothetical protein
MHIKLIIGAMAAAGLVTFIVDVTAGLLVILATVVFAISMRPKKPS